MDRFENFEADKRFGEAPVITEEDAQDVNIGREASNYYTALESQALDYTPEMPIQTVGEVNMAYEEAREVETAAELGLRQDIVTELAGQGLIRPQQAVEYYKAPTAPKEGALERLYAENLFNHSGAEDNDVRNMILDNPVETQMLQRTAANNAVLVSKIQSLNDDTLWLSKAATWYSGALTGVDTYRMGKYSMDPSQRFYYNPEGNVEIALKNYSLNKWCAGMMDTEDYDMFLDEYIGLLRERGLANASIIDALMALHDPKGNVTVARLAPVFDSLDVLTVGIGVGSVVAGGVKAGVSPKVLLKETSKATVKEILSAEPLATNAVNLVNKPVKRTRDFVRDIADAKRYAGNMEGAAKSVADAIKTGEAVIETAGEARSKLDTIYNKVLDPAFKVNTEAVPQVGRSEAAAKSLLEPESTYALTEEAFAKTTDMTVDRVFQEAVETRFSDTWGRLFNKVDGVDYWEAAGESGNLATISGIQPVFTGSGKVQGRVILGNNILDNPAKGFATKEQAGKAIERWLKDGNWTGLNKAEKDIQVYLADNGRWYVQFTGDLSSDIGKLFTDYEQATGKIRGNIFDKFLGTRGSLTSSLEDLQNLVNRDTRAIENALAPYQKNIERLSKPKRMLLEDLKEHSEGIWMDPKWLLSQGVPEDVVVAYQSARVIEDTGFLMREADMLKRLKEDGAQRIILGLDADAPTITGKVMSLEDVDFDNKFFTKADGTDEGFKATKDDFINGKYKDFAIIEQGKPLGEHLPANMAYRIFPKNELRFADLDIGGFGYIPGFRHTYSPNTRFVKQPVFSTLPDGRKVLTDIKTLRGSTNASEAVAYARNLEDIRMQVSEWLLMSPKKQEQSRRALNQYIRENTGEFFSFNNVDDALAAFKKEGISLDKNAKIGVVKEGDSSVIFKDDLKKLLNEKEQEDFERFVKRYSFSSASELSRLERGEGIKQISSDSHTPWIDLRDETRKAIRDIEKAGTMEDYTRLFAGEWANTFRDILPARVDPVKALRDGKYLSGAPKAMVSRADYARDIHNFMRGIPNRLDAAIEQSIANTLDSIGESLPWIKQVPFLGGAFTEGSKAYEALTKLSPLNFLRTMTAHYYLGFFNPRQLFTQSAAVTNTILISPKNGIEALPFAVILPALIRKSDDASYKWGVRFLKANGIDITTKQLKQAVENVKHMNVFGPSVKAGGAIEEVSKIRNMAERISLAPFEMGEEFNRGHSAIVALMDNQKLFEDISALNTKEYSKILVRQGDLYMNMGKVGIATAQMSQIGKTALQMKGIQFRMLEAIVKGNLTYGERMRLLIGHFILTGVEGLTGSPRLAYNFYDGMTNIGVPDEVALSLQEGLLNTLSRQLMDTPMDFGEIYSPNYLQLFSDMWEQFTTAPLKYVASSSAAGKTWDTVSTLGNIATDVVFGRGNAETAKYELEMLAARKSLPSSWNRAYTGYQALLNGRKLNASGKLVASDVDNTGAVLTMTGFNTIKEKDIREMSLRYADYKNAVKNFVEDVRLQWIDYCEDPTNESKFNLFWAHVKNVRDNYNLTDEQVAEAWKDLNRMAKDVSPDALGKVLPMMYKVFGVNRAEEIYRIRK